MYFGSYSLVMTMREACTSRQTSSSPINHYQVVLQWHYRFLVADTRLYTLPCRSVGRSVGRYVGPSVTFLNSERFLHYCSCPTVRDWIAVYPALFCNIEENCFSYSLVVKRISVQHIVLKWIGKQGRIHRSPVADGWAAAAMQKPLAIQKCNGRTDQHGKV